MEVVDIPGGERLLTLLDQACFNPLAFSPEGQLLASATNYKGVLCYSFRTRARTYLPINSRDTHSVAFSADRHRLGVTDDVGISLWDVHKDQSALCLGTSLFAH